jgi:hypothetical protein
MHWIDPDHLPEITGTVDQFLVNKHGEADGFLLTSGEEVHVPPHLSARLLRDVRPGSRVKVRGVRPWRADDRGRRDRYGERAHSRRRSASAR